MKISRDNPCYYLTSVAKDRLAVFQTEKLKQIACQSLAEARLSGDFMIFAYVIMPDHIHFISDGTRKISEIFRFVNGIMARRVIDYLKAKGFQSSLAKLRQAEKKHNYKHSLWIHHPHAFLVTNEATFMQKVNYIHQNPVCAGLVEKAEDYLYSSVRIWQKTMLEIEPLEIDLNEIDWRKK